MSWSVLSPSDKKVGMTNAVPSTFGPRGLLIAMSLAVLGAGVAYLYYSGDLSSGLEYLKPRKYKQLDEDFEEGDETRMTLKELIDLIESGRVFSVFEKKELADRLREHANMAFNGRKYRDAVRIYSLAIELCPTIVVLWANRAACYLCMEEYEKVVADCKQAIDRDRRCIKAYFRRGTALMKLGKVRDALLDFTIVTHLEDYLITRNIAERQNALERLVEEEVARLNFKPYTGLASNAAIRQSIHIGFDLNEIYGGIPEGPEGTCEDLFGKAIAAARAERFEECYKHTCESYEVYSKLQITEADPTEENSRPWMPFMLDLLCFRAMFANLCNEPKLCGVILQEIEKHEPNSPRTSLIKIGQRTEDPKNLIAQLKNATEANPSDVFLLFQYGQVLAALEQHEKSLKLFQKVVELRPSFSLAHVQVALILYRSGQTEECLRVIRSAMDSNKEDAELFNYCGEFMLDMQDFNGAAEAFERSMKLNPKNEQPYINAAIIAFIQENDSKGINLLRRAESLDPRSDVVKLQLSSVLASNENLDEGDRIFEEAARLCRSETELRERIVMRENSIAQHRLHRMLMGGQ